MVADLLEPTISIADDALPADCLPMPRGSCDVFDSLAVQRRLRRDTAHSALIAVLVTEGRR